MLKRVEFRAAVSGLCSCNAMLYARKDCEDDGNRVGGFNGQDWWVSRGFEK